MANEGQYINPIIQAMVHTAQNAKDAEQLKEKIRASKANEDFQSHHLDIQTQQAERDRDLRKQEVANQTDQIHALIDQMHLGNVGKIQDIAHKGGDLRGIYNKLGINVTGGEGPTASYAAQPQIPTVTQPAPSSGLSIPGVGNGIDPSAFGGPEQAAANAGNQAQAVAAGTSAGQLPAKLQEMTEEGKIRKGLQDAQIASAQSIDKYNRASAERIAQWNNNARIQAAGMGLAAANAGANENAVDDIYVTGNRTLPAGKFGLAIERSVPKGWTPLTKADNEIFDNALQADNIIKNARSLATNSYNTNPGGAFQTMIGFGEGAATKNRIEGLLGTLSKYFGRETGRLTDPDIERAKKLVYDPKLTEAENLGNVQKLDELLSKKIALVTKKYPKEQLQAILSKRGLDPDKFSGTSQAAAPIVENWVRGADGKLVKQ